MSNPNFNKIVLVCKTCNLLDITLHEYHIGHELTIMEFNHDKYNDEVKE